MAKPADLEALLRGPEKWSRYLQSQHSGDEDYDFSGSDLSSISMFGREYHFSNHADFRNCTFGDLALVGVHINKGADFSGSRVVGNAQIQLQGNSGGGIVRFEGVRFEGGVYVQGGQHQMEFIDCVFSFGISFGGEFARGFACCGQGARVMGTVVGENCIFREWVKFDDISVAARKTGPGTLSGDVSFRKTEFRKTATFRGMKVEDSTIFSGAKFLGRTSFRDAVFKEAPIFEGATLYPETEFSVVERFDFQFPDTSSEGAEYRYRVLKSLMAKENALAEQLGFARLEMKAHSARLPLLNIYKVYGWLGNYGLSWARPAMCIMMSTALFTMLFLAIGCTSSSSNWAGSVILALANSFPFVGSLKWLTVEPLASPLGGGAKLGLAFLSIVQSLLSAVLLFLIGLGVRNRLRMK